MPRLRLRTLMIVMALVAVLLASGMWTTKMARLRGRYLQKASHHAKSLVVLNQIRSRRILAKQPGPDLEAWLKGFDDANGEWIPYHQSMAAKYRHLSWRPWLPIPPDPPQPK